MKGFNFRSIYLLSLLYASTSCSNGKNDKSIRATNNTSAVKASGIKNQGDNSTAAISKKRNINGFSLSSSAFNNNDSIPQIHTNYGSGPDNQPIPLSWANAPDGTNCFIIQMVDLDFGKIRKLHWVIGNIPATAVGLPTETPATSTDTPPTDTTAPTEPTSSAGKKVNEVLSYIGPSPPDGTLHHYEITIYAMSEDLSFRLDPNNSNKNKTILESNSLGFTSIIGTYKNTKN
jgi:Raf kinase inhibitor-like YbhB/YbcL family protein